MKNYLVKELGIKEAFTGETTNGVCYDKDNEWKEVELRLEIIKKSLDTITEKQNKITPKKLSNVEGGKGYITRRIE